MKPAAAPRPLPATETATLALAALAVGAVAMGVSPVFVRLAGVGPYASAFWRVALALPALWAWAAIEARLAGEPASLLRRPGGPILLAGLAFSADLVCWHLAILNTTVANATFLATLAPLWVILGAVLFLGETVGRRTVGGLLLCLAGAAALIGGSYSLAPERLHGDAFGLATSLFFGLYILAVRAAGRGARPGRITFVSSVVTAAVLLVVALIAGDRLLPPGPGGAAALVALALVSQAGGQGLLAYALRHLPAGFSSLVIFLEAVAAAAFGWLFLGEALTAFQAFGGALILIGVGVGRPARPAAEKAG